MADYHPTAVALRRASDECKRIEAALPDEPEDSDYEELERAEKKMDRAMAAWIEAGNPELPPEGAL